jgi:hypothetical protein
MKYLLVLLGALSLLGCSKNVIDDPGLAGIATELQPYFSRFQDEGAERGIIVDFQAAGISAHIEDIEEEGVLGLCSWTDIAEKEIVIDEPFWRTAGEGWREYVVFHELGHGFLLRDHLDNAHGDGTCVSIMYSGLGGCNEIYPVNREVYLDELFSRSGELSKRSIVIIN